MPFRVALSAQSVDGYRDRLSYAQLMLHQGRVGAGLAALGVREGDRVAVCLDNRAGREAVLTALGCMAIGAPVVPINIRASDDEMRHALDLVRPSLLVATATSVRRLRALSATRLAVVGSAEGLTHIVPDAERWPEPTSAVAPGLSVQIQAEAPACLLYTSGTTSRSKAVVHTHRSMLHAGLSMGSAVGLTTGDLYQGAFPFFTSSCLNLGCMSSWVHGAGFVMEHGVDGSERLRLIESECTTVYHGVPAVVRLMLEEFDDGVYDFRRVRRIAYGGAAMPPSTIERIAQRWPWMEQIHVWGMTESGPAGAWLPPHCLPTKAGSMGIAMPHCELRVVDDAGHSVERGQPGELLFRGPSMAAGYFENPAATAEAFRDGWLYTGDVVFEDESGLLHFVDRKKDVINRGGFKISSAAVEAVLHRFPGVADVAVVAVSSERLGEEIAACVVAEAGVAPDTVALAAWCRTRLADYEVPRYWRMLDALPRNPMGKILKRELRKMLDAQGFLPASDD